MEGQERGRGERVAMEYCYSIWLKFCRVAYI